MLCLSEAAARNPSVKLWHFASLLAWLSALDVPVIRLRLRGERRALRVALRIGNESGLQGKNLVDSNSRV
eukprot:scaffold1307_cov200-Pinguiococcus_pyrenoidosus.AAC.80